MKNLFVKLFFLIYIGCSSNISNLDPSVITVSDESFSIAVEAEGSPFSSYLIMSPYDSKDDLFEFILSGKVSFEEELIIFSYSQSPENLQPIVVYLIYYLPKNTEGAPAALVKFINNCSNLFFEEIKDVVNMPGSVYLKRGVSYEIPLGLNLFLKSCRYNKVLLINILNLTESEKNNLIYYLNHIFDDGGGKGSEVPRDWQ